MRTIDEALTIGDLKSWVQRIEYDEMLERGKFLFCPDCSTVRLWEIVDSGNYICPLCHECFYKERDEEKVRRVVFDAHGVTDECPRYYSITSEGCKLCVYHRGSEGFDAFCAYPE